MNDANDLTASLRTEYELLRTHYDAFDVKVLNIKSWSTLLVPGGIGLGINNMSVPIIILSLIAAAFLWVLEAYWKLFQHCHRARIDEIERYFRSKEELYIVPLQISSSWEREYDNKSENGRRRPSLINLAFRPFVLIPYFPIIALGLLSILYVLFHGDSSGIPQ